MGIEKLYRDDVPMTSEEQSIEEYNKLVDNCKDVKVSNIKIKENSYEKYEVIKEPNVRYFIMNKNKRWRTYSECYNEQLEKVMVANKKDNNKKYTLKILSTEYNSTYESVMDKMASDIADKEWILDTRYGDVIYSITIKLETEKEQIAEIENSIGFNGWININDLCIDNIQEWRFKWFDGIGWVEI